MKVVTGRMRMILPIVFLFTLIATSECAYFNTFYLAKHHFNEGERLRKQKNGVVDAAVKREYNDAIEWSSEILSNYTDSRYVDDSLFIIGMSNYYQEEYVQARTKFDELLRYFPKSDFALSAQYYKAQSLIKLNQTDEALLILADLNNTDDSHLRGMAGVSIAHIYQIKEDWQELAETAQKVIDADPDREQYVDAVYLKGEAFYQLEDYNSVIEVLTELSEDRLQSELRFKTNILLALSKAKLGKYDEAMNDLISMQNRGEFIDYAPRIRLEIGTIYELQGNKEQAIDTYTNLAGDFPDSLSAKEAWYKVGTLLLDDMANAQQAKEAFQKVRENRSTTVETWYADAQIKSVQIDSLLSKLKLIDTLNRRLGRAPERDVSEPDSILNENVNVSESGVQAIIESIPDSNVIVDKDSSLMLPVIDADPIEQLAEARFLLAEVYTYSFDRPDSAMTQYRLIVKDAPESEYAIKARFFMEANSLRNEGIYDSEHERELMERLIGEYPSSEFVQELKVYLGIIDKTPDSELITVAEQAKLNGDLPDVFIPLYQKVIDQYPRTKNAYRARLNIAYAREHFLGDRDGAVALYQALADEEPTANSQQFIEFARGKLDMLEREDKMLEDIANDIEYYTMVIRDLKSGAGITADGGISVGSGEAMVQLDTNDYVGLRKIRARNARIRSRYYTD